MLVPLAALIRKDLQLFFTDRRSVILSFIVPIAIASFFGAMFSGPPGNNAPARIAVALVDQDDSAISRSILEGAQSDDNLGVIVTDAATARANVRAGKTSVGVIVPKGFGEAAGSAFFNRGEKPALEVLYDPSHGPEVGMVRGILTGHVMRLDVRNQSARQLPLAPGWHPYFPCPVPLKRDCLAQLVPPQRLPATEPFECDVNVPVSRDCRTEFSVPDLGRIVLTSSDQVKTLEIWTPAGKPFVCVEPWCGPSNVINTTDAIRIDPGAVASFWLTVEVQR